nr:hypothetical protein [Anabaena sp. PCC 7108]
MINISSIFLKQRLGIPKNNFLGLFFLQIDLLGEVSGFNPTSPTDVSIEK